MSTGIEVQVFDGASPTTMLAVLQNAASVRWQEVLGDVGSGSFELAWADPKATSVNLHEGNLSKLLLNGAPVFSFFIESPVLTMAEAADSRWQIAGAGGLSYLSRALVYPPGWPTPTGISRTWAAATYGTILNTLLTEAQTRTTIPNMTWDFTTTKDSLGNAWTANVNLQLGVNANLLDVAKNLCALGMGIWMDPNLVLHAYIPGAQGANLASSVIWRQGRHIMGPVPNTGNGASLQTVCLVSGAGGAYVECTDAAMIASGYIGRREGGLSFSTGDATQMTNAGNQQIALTEANNTAITVPLNHGTGGLYEPYVDYRVGDTVALDVPGQYANYASQIVQLTIAQTDAADYTVEANLGTVALDETLRVAQQVASAAGTTSQASGGIAGNLTLAGAGLAAGIWTMPGLANSWVDFGGAFTSLGYRKDPMGYVHCELTLKSGTLGVAAFTFPVGYRPGSQLQFPAVSNAAFGLVQVATTGAVVPTGGSNASYGFQFTFLAEN